MPLLDLVGDLPLLSIRALAPRMSIPGEPTSSRGLAWFRLPDGSRVALGHGDFIGRVWTAALVLDDPRVSEGHAMVSLRGAELWMLALRRRFTVDGRSVGEVALRSGQSIAFADDLVLAVEAVDLPGEVFAVEAGGRRRWRCPQSRRCGDGLGQAWSAATIRAHPVWFGPPERVGGGRRPGW